MDVGKIVLPTQVHRSVMVFSDAMVVADLRKANAALRAERETVHRLLDSTGIPRKDIALRVADLIRRVG